MFCAFRKSVEDQTTVAIIEWKSSDEDYQSFLGKNDITIAVKFQVAGSGSHLC
jgi:hypothetical protein